MVRNLVPTVPEVAADCAEAGAAKACICKDFSEFDRRLEAARARMSGQAGSAEAAVPEEAPSATP